MMSRIGGRDTKPELTVRRFLHRRGFRYRLHDRSLPGRPDLVLRSYRTVVFVHGCFWHAHENCRLAYRPKSNEAFWQAKLARTRERDAQVAESLLAAGWSVLTVWECQLTGADLMDLERSIRRTVPREQGRGR